MPGMHFSWLELCILIPAVGALWVWLQRDAVRARWQSVFVCGLTLVCAVGAWQDFTFLQAQEARDPRNPLMSLVGINLLAIDELSAPLLPLAALLHLLTHLATLRTKVREYSFARSLVYESILLATFACKSPWGIVALLAAGAVPPYFELRRGGKPTRVYVLFMALFVGLLFVGQTLLALVPAPSLLAMFAVLCLMAALLLRSGVAPVHCWMTDLFEHASFGTALLYVTPMVGAYGLVRLVLPIAPVWVLTTVSLASLLTAVYAAGMALVQREARRFFCYLFLSHSSLVLVGLETATPIGLTGALSVWFSVSISLTGFGLVMRCIETRTGRLSLLDFHGLYPHVPSLAAFFLLTGLASIGFPGTAGFVGLEILVEGVVRALPVAGAFVVMVAALNGLAVLHAYFRIFTGKTHTTSIDLNVRPAERIAVLVLTALIIGGGLVPQPSVNSRFRAAVSLVQARTERGLDKAPIGGQSRTQHTSAIPISEDSSGTPHRAARIGHLAAQR